jgi:hypothetical protein
MTAFLASITILSLALCGVDKNVIMENLEIEKTANKITNEKTIYKKIPTKWVKITKKSN